MKASSLIFSALWWADTLLTCEFVKQGGPSMEANPLMRAVFEHGGIPEFVALKAAILLLFLCVESRVWWRIRWALCFIMAPIVLVSILTLVEYGS